MDRFEYFKNLLLPEEFEQIQKYPTLCRMLQDACARFKERCALRWQGGEASYERLFNDVAAARGYIAGLSLPHSHVGVLCHNDYGFAVACLGAATLGKVAVLLPAALPTPALAGAIQKYDIDHVICAESLEGNLPEGAPHTVVGAARAEPVPMANVQPGDPAVIIFSGGTTGRPKGALLSHGALMRGAFNGCLAYKTVMYHRYLSLVPLTHVFGLVRNLFTALCTGSSVYFCPDMRQMAAAFGDCRPTILVAVPALADMLLKLAKLHGLGMLGGALEVIICGGAAVAPKLVHRWEELGVHVLPGYGLTETANLVSGNGDPLKYPDSVGVPYPEQELKIVNGELWVKGDHLLSGYYNDPEETAASMEDGFFKTGDLARLDENGFLYIVGRSKNIIVRQSGENVSPEELEALANALPLVQDCLVYEKQNLLTLEVLPEQSAAAAMSGEELHKKLQEGIDGINQGLMEHMQIEKLVVRREDFPRSPSLKILRPRGDEQ